MKERTWEDTGPALQGGPCPRVSPPLSGTEDGHQNLPYGLPGTVPTASPEGRTESW